MEQLISLFEQDLTRNTIISGLAIALIMVLIFFIKKTNSQALRLKLTNKMVNNQIEMPAVLNKMSMKTLKLSYVEIINYFAGMFNKTTATDDIRTTLYWINNSIKDESKKKYLLDQFNEVTKKSVSLECIATILSEAIITEAKYPSIESTDRNIHDFILEYIKSSPNELIKDFVASFEKNIMARINNADSKEYIKTILAGELAKVKYYFCKK